MKKDKILFLLCTILLQGTFNSCFAKTEEVITNPKRWDGFGSQYMMIIVSAVYAELNNKKFVYTPFKEMEHNYDNDPEFLAKKEWLINFIGNFEINENDMIKQKVNHNYGQFFDANLDRALNSLAFKKIKRVFRSNKNINDYFNNENFNIAVHVRRPNLHDNRVFGTDTPDDFYLNVINRLRVIYSSKNPLFHVHSQGSSENFKKFNGEDIVLHLNESIEDSFTSLVLADVLITGQSCFSYVAGILSEGIVFYMPCPVPLPGWIPTDELLK